MLEQFPMVDDESGSDCYEKLERAATLFLSVVLAKTELRPSKKKKRLLQNFIHFYVGTRIIFGHRVQ